MKISWFPIYIFEKSTDFHTKVIVLLIGVMIRLRYDLIFFFD